MRKLRLHLVKAHLIPGQSVCSHTLQTGLLWTLNTLLGIMELPVLLYVLPGERDPAEWKAHPLYLSQ